jgi:hypothetical protein
VVLPRRGWLTQQRARVNLGSGGSPADGKSVVGDRLTRRGIGGGRSPDPHHGRTLSLGARLAAGDPDGGEIWAETGELVGRRVS